MLDSKKKAFVIATCRRATFRWKPRGEALKASKAGRNQYRCAMCPSNKFYGNKDKQLDHVEPAVRLSGWVSADDFIDRLLCDVSGFQVLCKPHHAEKTLKEKQIRKEFRLMAKKAKEKIGGE